MGLSVLVSEETERLGVKVTWADYLPVARPGEPDAPVVTPDDATPPEERERSSQWRRLPREDQQVVTLAPGTQTVGLPNFDELKLVVSVRQVGDHGMVPRRARSVSVFLVNHRKPDDDQAGPHRAAGLA